MTHREIHEEAEPELESQESPHPDHEEVVELEPFWQELCDQATD